MAEGYRYKTKFIWSDEKVSESVGYKYEGEHKNVHVTIIPVCMMNYHGYKRKCAKIELKRVGGSLLRVVYCNQNMLTHRVKQLVCSPDDINWFVSKIDIVFSNSTLCTEYKASMQYIFVMHDYDSDKYLIVAGKQVKQVLEDVTKYVFQPYMIVYMVEAVEDVYTDFINHPALTGNKVKEYWYKYNAETKIYIDKFMKNLQG